MALLIIDDSEVCMENLHKDSAAAEYSPNLYEVVFSPLLERAEYQNEPMRSKLIQLMEKMGVEDFNKYINSLVRINYNGKALLLITKKEINKTFIEGRYLSIIAEVFETTNIRVVAQA